MLKPTTSDFPRNGFFGISAVLGKMKTFEPRSLMPVFAWCLTLTLQMTPIKEVSALQQEWAFIIYSISNASKIKFRVLVLQLLDFLSFPVLIIKFPFRTLSPNPFLDPYTHLLSFGAPTSKLTIYTVFLEIKFFFNFSSYDSAIIW